MNQTTRQFFKKRGYTYLFIFFYWLFNVFVVSAISLYTLIAFLDYLNVDKATIQDPFIRYWVSEKQLVESLIFASLTAFLFIVVHEWAEKRKWDRLSFGMVILRKSIWYIVGFLVIFFITFQFLVAIGFYDNIDFRELDINPSAILTISLIGGYMIYLVIMLNFILQTTKKVGGNTLLKFLSGKYHVPIIEEKIFLFMDLKSSTMYAEKLGNLKYSRLLKDCFDDMNFIVEKYDAEIYQYVGDEIVLCWDMKKGLNNLNFIEVFFSFQKILLDRNTYYMEKYGILPEFKAGANGGAISVAEVGNFKREIAFHGDVINTASRVESICNQYNERFLVTGNLLSKVGELNGFKSKHIGAIQLRGKEKPLDVYAINT